MVAWELPTPTEVRREIDRAELVDVLLTHDAPVPRIDAISPELRELPGHDAGAVNRRAMWEIASAYKPRLAFHGHYHMRRDYRVELASGKLVAVRCLDLAGAKPGSFTILDTESLAVVPAWRLS